LKTVIIYGFEHKGSTYNAVQNFKNQLNVCKEDLTEFFLPRDMPYFCTGCNNCFMRGEAFCPHKDYITPIKNAIWNAELIVFASPVYVFHVTGQMKALLDHFAFQFMAHRPNESMFSKTALIVSIGAGGGMDTAIKDISTSLNWWGISCIFTFGFAVRAAKWDEVTEKNKLKMERKIKNISNKIKLKINKSKPGLNVRFLFFINRIVQKKYGYIPYDKDYWEKNSWLDKNRPWKIASPRVAITTS
jgi:multimeric flavodoxin WrbA